MRLIITATAIDGLVMVGTTSVKDFRGQFYRAFCDQELKPLLQGRSIRQVNLSQTTAVGALRGLHFQTPPAAEMKLIRCLRGRVWDVGVDLRQHSSTFLQWIGVELSPNSQQMVVIPEGCAHGFQVLEPESELLYLHTAAYSPSAERGCRYDDPRLNIDWPLDVTEISQRDLSHPRLAEDFMGIPT